MAANYGAAPASSLMPEVVLTLETLRERGIALHRAGRIAEAEPIYAEVLRRDPADVEVLHLQGVIAHQSGRHDYAVDLIGQAISLRATTAAYLSLGAALMALGRCLEALASYDAALALQPQLAIALSCSAAALRDLGRPQEALARASAAIAVQPTTDSYCHQGAAWLDLGQFAAAVTSFDKAIALSPQCVEAHNYRGLALQRLQRSVEALASFDRALSLRPQSAELHNNRGNVLRHLQRLPEALAAYERAIALEPRFAAAHNNRGLVFQALQQYREAASSYEHALALQPAFAEAHNNLGTVQCELGQPAQALESCQRALQLQPDLRGVHGNLGNALRDLQRPQEALAHYELALLEAPSHADNHCHRGNALFDLKRLADAMASYQRAVELNPRHAQAHFNNGLCLLLAGEFAQGLPEYEWRKELNPAAAPIISAPLWLGETPIAGKTLFVHADQALGDTIQFCRYAKLAEERGAHVTLAVQSQLQELLTGLSATIRVVAPGEHTGGFDYHCALMSLPLAFRTTLADIPAAVPYLCVDPRRVARWGERIGPAGFKVGVVWQGSRNRIDVGRSVPLEMFERLTSIPGVRLISLQKSDAPEQLLPGSKDLPLELLGDGYDVGPQAFLDSAAVMTHLDLIITCDTALAHLAGALGRPTWIALKHVPDWRWLLERTDSPWYPSARLFRQPRRGDWDGVFAAIERELRRLTQAARQGSSP
jgi:tetratricopeptide (TPR) repeat protein